MPAGGDPCGAGGPSFRDGCIKSRFTKLWVAGGAPKTGVSVSRAKRHEGGIWQRRFWDHRIRDEEDLIRHVNYIHYNPIKHGLVRCPHAWPHSSFLRWVQEGSPFKVLIFKRIA